PKTQDLGPKTSDSNPKCRRWLMSVKNNLAEEGAVPGLAFELVEGRIRWRKKETVPELAEVLLPNVHNNDRRRLRRAACEWLEEALADGPMPSGEVIKQALSCGISRGTLQRAITDLGIKSHKSAFNGGWEMRWTPQYEPPRREPVFGRDGGFRIVGAELLGEGGSGREGEGEMERQSEGAAEGRELTTREGGKETTGQGEAVASPNSSCASSEKRGDYAIASCASSEANGCQGLETLTERGPDVARSPDLATAATEGLPSAKPDGGDLRCNGCQGLETLTERAGASCASSEKQGDSSSVSCASSEVEEEEPMPHWMERWYQTTRAAARKAC
ncbi:MAG: hypothetical protein ACREHD_30675, partial [Pirellulales bacterium]